LKFLVIVAGAAALASAFMPASAQAEKIKIAIASRSMNYAPYFVPLAKGYYKEEGFTEVELIDAGGGVATPAQISGEIDFNTSASAALSAVLKGASLKIIYFPWDRIPYQVYVTDPALKTLADLKGKQVGIQSRGDTFEVAMRMALKQEGLDPNSVIYSALGVGATRRAALAARSVPAAIISPIDANVLRASGELKDSRMIYDLGEKVQLPLTGTAVRTVDIEKNRDRVKRFLRAVSKGMAYTAAFRDATVDIVMSYNKGADRDSIAATYDETLAGRTEYGAISEKLMRQEADVRAEIINVPKDKIPPLEKIYDFSIVRDATNELQREGWKPTR
jgi:NitT/TauT family transport system substrate-binding protein